MEDDKLRRPALARVVRDMVPASRNRVRASNIEPTWDHTGRERIHRRHARVTAQARPRAKGEVGRQGLNSTSLIFQHDMPVVESWGMTYKPTMSFKILKHVPTVWVVVAILVIASGRAAPFEEAACDPSEDAVRRVMERIVEGDNRRDLEGVLACYTEDVVWLPPRGLPVLGKASIRARYETLFSRFQPDIRVVVEEVRVSPEIALARGGTRGALTPIDSGLIQLLDDKFLAALRCQDGHWLVSHLAWSPLDRPQN